ncbi:MAG: PIN domain-containing protein [Planctomycetota bacterium]
MHSHFTVVFDACVLYPATLRNLLLQLATSGLFRARWTEEIHSEWIRNLLIDRPDIDPRKLQRLRILIDRAVPDCLVTGFEPLIGGLSLPDGNDRHVLAAAIRCQAAIIVTANLRDFPDRALVPLGVRAQHPDDFIAALIDLDAETVCQGAKIMRHRLKNPPYTANEFLDLLRRHTLSKSAVKLQRFSELL